MYKSTGNPSVAKFKARLVRIQECSESGRVLAQRWNPKGRNFEIQRQMIKFFSSNEEICKRMLDHLNKGNGRG